MRTAFRMLRHQVVLPRDVESTDHLKQSRTTDGIPPVGSPGGFLLGIG